MWMILFFGCARSPLKNKKHLFRSINQSKSFDEIEASSDRKTLVLSLDHQINFLSNIPDLNTAVMEFGQYQIRTIDYVESLKKLKKFILDDNSSRESLKDFIKDNFDILQPYGNSDGWGKFKLTGYYEPIINGSKVKTKKYSQALYSKPTDLVTLNLNEFMNLHPEWFDKLDQEKFKFPSQTYARLEEIGIDKKIVPYYSRLELDDHLVLNGKGYEICYVDPVDAFFLQIQGSGTVMLSKNQKLSLTYSGQNGHKYFPIGKELINIIPLNQMSKNRIEDHLRTLSEEDMKSILFKNPSYVFFQKSNGERGITFQGTEVVDLRTIATDSNLFPKGALAILDVKKWNPKIGEVDKTNETSKITSLVTFVFDQDTGGAIRGPGRVDYFIGSGDSAGELAGSLNHDAELFYLIPKSQ